MTQRVSQLSLHDSLLEFLGQKSRQKYIAQIFNGVFKTIEVLTN